MELEHGTKNEMGGRWTTKGEGERPFLKKEGVSSIRKNEIDLGGEGRKRGAFFPPLFPSCFPTSLSVEIVF